MTPEAFRDRFGPLADRAAATGLDRWLILAQWALESAYGSSPLSVYCHNLAGLTDRYYGSCGQSRFGSFASYEQFEELYVWTLLHAGQPPGSGTYYADVRAAAGQPLGVQADALAASPWSAEHYGGSGAKLLEFARSMGWTPPTPPAPTPAPTPPPQPAPTPEPALAAFFAFEMRNSALLVPTTVVCTFEQAMAYAVFSCKDNPGSTCTVETTIGPIGN